jgi:hypothetical protein
MAATVTKEAAADVAKDINGLKVDDGTPENEVRGVGWTWIASLPKGGLDQL